MDFSASARIENHYFVNDVRQLVHPPVSRTVYQAVNLGVHEGRSTPRETRDRQDVHCNFFLLHALFPNAFLVLSRHIPTIVVQGRYDVIAPVRTDIICGLLNLIHSLQVTTAYALKKVQVRSQLDPNITDSLHRFGQKSH